MNAIAKTSSLCLVTLAATPFVVFCAMMSLATSGCESKKGGVDSGVPAAPMIAPATPDTTAATTTTTAADTAAPLGAAPLGATPLTHPVAHSTVVKYADGGLAHVLPGATVPPGATVMPNATAFPGMPTVFPPMPSGLVIPTALPSGMVIPTALPSGMVIPTALPSGMTIPTNLQFPTPPPQK